MKPQRKLSFKVLLLLYFFALTLFFIAPLVSPVSAAAGIYRTINFQGKLVNKTDGTNITNGSYSFTFKFYDASSGGTQLPSGTPWSETQSLTVTDGIFRATLGSSTSIPTSLDFNSDSLYLDITFNGEVFSTRVRMTGVPYAFNAEKVAGLTVTNTTGTLTIPNGTTVSFGGAFTTSGASALTLTTSGTTNVTLPTTGTLITLAGSEILTNKSIGSTGLTFSGATTDITTGTDEALTIVPNGTGDFILTADADSNAQINSTVSSDATINPFALTFTDNASASTGTVYVGDITNADNSTNTGVPDALLRLNNANGAETVAKGLFVDQTGAGTLTDGIYVTNSGGNITSGITVADTAGGTLATGLNFTGTFTNLISAPNFSLSNTGQLTIGGDVNLYRNAANELKTDDYLFSAAQIAAEHGGASEVRLGAVGPSSEAGIKFGSAVDTNLYRSAANTLKTDDTFVAASGISIGSSQSYTGSGAVTLSSGGSSALTLDSASGRVAVATGDYLSISVAGVAGAASGDIWYDSTATKFKINENGTVKTLCNTTDAGCGAGGGGARLDQITAATAEGGAQDSNANTVAWNWDFTTAAVDSGLLISESTASTNGTQGQQALLELITLSSSTASPLQVTAGGADVGDIFFDLSGASDLEIRDNGTAFATFDDSGGITFAPQGTSDIILTLDDDSNLIINDTITNSGQIFDINTTLGGDADADTVSALNIDVTSAATGDSDVLRALSLNVTSPDATVREIGIDIGSGFDEDIHFASAAARIRFQDGGQIKFTDGSMGGNGNRDLPQGRLIEYFSGANYGVFESGGFINIDGSYFQDNFNQGRPRVTADNASSITSRLGDSFEWNFDEGGTGGTTNTHTVAGGCTVDQNNTNFGTNDSWGNMAVAIDSNNFTGTVNTNQDNGCKFHMGLNSGTQTAGNLMVSKKFVQYFKVKPSANWTTTPTNRQMFLGADNYSQIYQNEAWSQTNTNSGGIYMSNWGGTQTNAARITQWAGMARRGTNILTVGCSQDIVTSGYALMRLEARGTNDLHFFVDNDVSNGVALSECGSGINTSLAATVTNAIPTWPIGPVMMFQHNQSVVTMGGTSMVTYYVDLYANVQDDPRDQGGQVAGLTTGPDEVAPPSGPPPPPDPIPGADLAEHYYFNDQAVESGDIVAMNDLAPGMADKATTAYERKMVGVVATSPALVMGESSEQTKPVALTGRVPVKISGRGGPIKVGDPITSSEDPGIGMKATKPGKILGTAMEAYDGSTSSADSEKTILVNVNVGYYLGDEGDTALIEQKGELAFGANEIDTATDSAVADSGSENSMAAATAEIVKKVVFKGLVDFMDTVTFRRGVEFWAGVLFKSNVIFAGQVTFNKDSAGYATIRKGSRFVDIQFEKEYEHEPVVNISVLLSRITQDKLQELAISGDCDLQAGTDACQDKIAATTLGGDIKAAVTGKSKQGFIILLNQPAPLDMTFSWSAVAVSDPKTSLGQSNTLGGPPGQVAGLSTAISPTPTEKVEGSPTPTISPSPTPTAQTQSIKISPTELGYVRLRSVASVDGEELDQVPSGTTLTFTDKEDGWYKIEYNDKTGWVSGEYVELL